MDDIGSIIMELSEAERTLAENKWRGGGSSRSLEKRLTSADIEDEVEDYWKRLIHNIRFRIWSSPLIYCMNTSPDILTQVLVK